MSIEWIPIGVRLPHNRRRVLCWGHDTEGWGPQEFGMGPSMFLGVSRCNVSANGHAFDVENKGRKGWFKRRRLVTHWADLTPPEGIVAPRDPGLLP